MNRRDFLKIVGFSGLGLTGCGQISQTIPTNGSKPIVVLNSFNTVSAYDLSRGSNLYQGTNGSGRTGRDRSVPYLEAQDSFASGFLFWASRQPEFTQFQFIGDQDMEDENVLNNAKVLVVVGHSEYWTQTARRHFDRFVARGGHVAILSGDCMGVQVRYEADNMVCYKVKSEDPETNPLLKTVFWNDPTLAYPIEQSIGNSYSHGGFGDTTNGKMHSKYGGYKLVSNSPVFDGIDTSKILELKTHEFDGVPLLGFDKEWTPIVDTKALGFYQFELLGFNIGNDYLDDPITEFYVNADPKAQTFIAFQKTKTSGKVINVSSTNWCQDLSGDLGIVTRNIIFKLLQNEEVFSHV